MSPRIDRLVRDRWRAEDSSLLAARYNAFRTANQLIKSIHMDPPTALLSFSFPLHGFHEKTAISPPPGHGPSICSHSPALCFPHFNRPADQELSRFGVDDRTDDTAPHWGLSNILPALLPIASRQAIAG